MGWPQPGAGLNPRTAIVLIALLSLGFSAPLWLVVADLLELRTRTAGGQLPPPSSLPEPQRTELPQCTTAGPSPASLHRLVRSHPRGGAVDTQSYNTTDLSTGLRPKPPRQVDALSIGCEQAENEPDAGRGKLTRSLKEFGVADTAPASASSHFPNGPSTLTLILTRG